MGHHKHLEGNENSKSHQYQIVSGVGFVIVWGLDTFAFEFSTQLNAYANGLVRFIISIPVFLLAFYLMWAAGKALFVETEHSSGLLTGGILAHVRHPLYLGSLLIYLGCLVNSVSLLALLVYIIQWVAHNDLANFEEADLIRVYGDEYIEYRKKVPKWIPRIRANWIKNRPREKSLLIQPTILFFMSIPASRKPYATQYVWVLKLYSNMSMFCNLRYFMDREWKILPGCYNPGFLLGIVCRSMTLIWIAISSDLVKIIFVSIIPSGWKIFYQKINWLTENCL